ncbi:hypothetical protein LCGC14_0413840 [marine sediment metagenome]|uniref:Uncharacterized protein n=1 Tax=marine sediment metagenome TaxID=412755 RepID=A0A0F9W202_9ZZZZ
MRVDEIRLLLASPVRSLSTSIQEKNLEMAGNWTTMIINYMRASRFYANQMHVRLIGSHTCINPTTFDEWNTLHRIAIFKVERAMAETCHGIIAYQSEGNSSEGVEKILRDMAHLPVFFLSGDLKIGEDEMTEIQNFIENIGRNALNESTASA